MKRAPGFLLLLACALLAGCETVRIQEPAAVIEESRPANLRAADLAPLLRYFEHIAQLAPADVGAEFARARTRFAGEKSEYSRLRLALFGLLPNASAADRSRSLELLEPLLKQKPESAPARSVAVLLSTVIDESEKREQSVKELQESMREVKDNAQSQKDSTLSLNQKLKDAQRREAALQEKLDALKDMESNLMERERVRPIRKK